MERTVYKFPVNTRGGKVSIPGCREVVLFGTDGRGLMCVWAEVNASDPNPKTIEFRVVGTGRPVHLDWDHRLSYVAADGFVWHLYEVTG